MAQDLERLKLAFAVSIAKSVVDADDRTDHAEFQLFGQIFPRTLLRDHGFLDEDGRFTPALEQAFAEARATLPAALSPEEKLDVLTIFYGASVADDELDSRELAIVREAAQLLGVSVGTLSAHLAQVQAKVSDSGEG